MKQVDIAIIGGGLVGASFALALQKGARARGWHIALIEPFAPGDSAQPSYDARASALTYGSQQIYQQLGIWTEVAAQVQAILNIHVSDQGHFAKLRISAEAEQVPALGYVVENAWLGHCLWRALDDEVVHRYCPAYVQQIQAQAGGYQLHLNSGEFLSCKLAVLADGGRSGLREQLGIQVRNRSYGQTAIIANVTPVLAHQGRAFERFTPLGPMALLPLPGERCVLIWTWPPEEAQRLACLPEKQFLAELQECFGYRLGEFKKVGARHLYPLGLIQSDEQVRRNLVVLGNAAHSMHPVAGQGYNLSLRDAMTLAEHLLASHAPLGDLATLQNYLASQARDQARTIGFSDDVVRIFSNSRRSLVVGRNLGLLGLNLLPPAKHWFVRQAMGLGSRPLAIQGDSDAG